MASSVLTINLASVRQLGNTASSHFTQSAGLLSESGSVCFFFSIHLNKVGVKMTDSAEERL